MFSIDKQFEQQTGIKVDLVPDTEETKSIPVVMVTGVTIDFKKFIQSRKLVPLPDAYFEKPVDQEAFLSNVLELLA